VLKSSYGDHKWVLEIGTTYLDASGNELSPKFTHTVSVEDLDEAIESSIAQLCALIDWSPLVIDKEAPYVYQSTPTGSGISIFSNIGFIIGDALPSAGIDISNMKVILNNSMTDIDITNELIVDEYFNQYTFIWSPPLRVFSTYD
jgi:hypothetical protein